MRPLGPGYLELEPEKLELGEQPTLTQVEKPLLVRNAGKLSITVVAVKLLGAGAARFSTNVDVPFKLDGESTRPIVVRFDSGEVTAQYEAQLVLEVEGAEEPSYSATLTGSAKEGIRPRWIAFDSNRAGGNVDLYVVRADGSGLKRLTTDAWVEAEPAFSPDGKSLAFVSDRDDFTLQIFIMDLATRTVQQVTRGSLSARQPAWSPDGKRLAFHRGIGVYTIAIDGTDEQHVIDGSNALNAYQHPSYLPGGKWLVVDRGNQIDLVRPDGSEKRAVVQNDALKILAPSPSPSGATVAFAAFCGGGFSVRSVPTSALNTACGGASEVQFPGRRPAWGPEQIAFETDEANSDIMVVPATGGAPLNLSRDAANDRNPAWAPEDTVIP